MKIVQIFTAQLLALAFFSAPLQAEEYPEATATTDPNVVVSPFPPNKKVDITGFLPGDLARDPNTNKVFRVPVKLSTPLVFKPEIIEDDPPAEPPKTVPPIDDPTLGDLPIRRPEVVEDPATTTPEIPRPPAVAESDLPPLGETTAKTAPPVPVEPVIPSRSSREIDEPLTDFVREFIRSGQQNDPASQAKYLAATLTSHYGTIDATREQVIQERAAFITKWPRRIYVESGKPRFVSWITETTDDAFIVDIRVYQSLKSAEDESVRGYADHRLSIREKSDGSFEITGTEERHPKSILAGQ